MTKSQLTWVRMVGVCFPIAMLVIVMLDMGGQPFRADALYPHYWFGQGFGWISAGFTAAGIIGSLAMATRLTRKSGLVMFAQAILAASMLTEVALEASFHSPRDLGGWTAFGIAVAAYLISNAAVTAWSKPMTRPSILAGSPYPR